MNDLHGMPLPNPGSDAAREAGCICAVLDNNHGKYPPWIDPEGWWITEGCPVHCPAGFAGHPYVEDVVVKNDVL